MESFAADFFFFFPCPHFISSFLYKLWAVLLTFLWSSTERRGTNNLLCCVCTIQEALTVAFMILAPFWCLGTFWESLYPLGGIVGWAADVTSSLGMWRACMYPLCAKRDGQNHKCLQDYPGELLHEDPSQFDFAITKKNPTKPKMKALNLLLVAVVDSQYGRNVRCLLAHVLEKV